MYGCTVLFSRFQEKALNVNDLDVNGFIKQFYHYIHCAHYNVSCSNRPLNQLQMSVFWCNVRLNSAVTLLLAQCVYLCTYGIYRQFVPVSNLKITIKMREKLWWIHWNHWPYILFFPSLSFCFPHLTLLFVCFFSPHHCFLYCFLHQSAFLSSEHPVNSCPNEWRGVWLLLLFSLLLSTVFACL